MLSAKFGHKLDRPIAFIIRGSFLSRINPTTLTVLGLVCSIFAAVTIVYGMWKAAALLILASGFFDMLDGATARIQNKTTRFGGFIDSVLDRYSDMLVLIAFVVFFSGEKNMFMVFICSITAIGTVLTSYTRARAEAILPECKVGILERPERMILIVIACFLDSIIMPVFLFLALFSHITVFQRIYYTWKVTAKKSP